jgi:hypothetical protein
VESAARAAAPVAARDVIGAMRPEFDHNAVFPRRMLALL